MRNRKKEKKGKEKQKHYLEEGNKSERKKEEKGYQNEEIRYKMPKKNE